jgi:hypothetical protein
MLWVGDNTNKYLRTTQTVNDGRWHFITGTYDGTTATLYIDGKSAASRAGTNELNNTTSNLTVGVYNDGLTGPFNGFIDDARIYNRALSATDVRQLYNASR